jgi:F-type H+-transporting ATPase subunit b
MLLALLVAEGGEGMSPFSVNGGLTLWTIVVFVLLLLLLKKFAFPAIIKATEEREQTIARQLDDAAKANAEAQALLAEHKKLVADSRVSAQQMLAEATASAEKERAAAVEKTRHEQDELIARTRRELQAEREKAIAELRREAVDLSLAAAGKLIGQRMDSATDRQLVESFLRTVEKSS